MIVRVDSLALSKITNEEEYSLDPKKSKRELCQRIFVLGIFWGGRGRGSRYTATPLIVALSLGHNDITRFRPWSPIATGNLSDPAEQETFQKLLRRLAQLTFQIRVQAFCFVTHFAESFRISTS